MNHRTLLVCFSILLLLTTVASAAPTLRLNTSGLRPIFVQQGTNGPGNVFFEASNAGDGSLNLQVKGSHTWLAPTVGAARTCSLDTSKNCLPINVVLSSTSLAPGVYSGVITVSDANAFDAPQNVRVTVFVGGNVPAKLDFFLPLTPRANDAISFQTQGGPPPALRPTTQTGGNWLAVSSSGMGSFQFLYTHRVQATVQSGMAAGDFNGSVAISNSSFAGDNKAVAVTLHVTTQPIARPSASQLRFRLVQGTAAVEQPVTLANGGQGTLTISGATTAGGTWLTATVGSGGTVQVKADPTSLAAGFFNGAVTINSNAANSPTIVPVELEVLAAGAPLTEFSAVVDAASFLSVGGGALASLFGSQLATGVAQAGSIPLPTTLANATVFVNDAPVPLIFVSPGQINFQMPFEVSGTARVRVERQGQRGNTVTVQVGRRSPGLYGFPGTTFGIVQNASRGNAFAWPDIPALAGVPKAAARPGDVLVLYGSGLGPVNPSVATGAAAGSSPISSVTDTPQVNFGRGVFGPFADPQFVGLAPGFVGLYQVNVQVPALPPNARTPVSLLFPDNATSNIVEIAVEAP